MQIIDRKMYYDEEGKVVVVSLWEGVGRHVIPIMNEREYVPKWALIGPDGKCVSTSSDDVENVLAILTVAKEMDDRGDRVEVFRLEAGISSHNCLLAVEAR